MKVLPICTENRQFQLIHSQKRSRGWLFSFM